MESNIINTEFRTPEMIVVEIKAAIDQVNQTAILGTIKIGKCFKELKELVPHGQWLDFIEENVGFSSRKVQQCIQVSDSYGDENSSFYQMISNTHTCADLSFSKALRLLSVPDEDLEGFVQGNDISGMTVKELEERIKAISDEKTASDERIEKLGDDLVAAEEDKLRLADEVDELKKKLVDLEAVGADSEDGISEEAQAEIDKYKKDIEKAEKKAQTSTDKVEKLQGEIEKMKSLQQVALEEARAAAMEEGRAQGKQENDGDIQKYKTEADEAAKAQRDAEKKLAASSDKDLMRISFLTEQLQKTFNEAVEILENIEVNDKEQGGKLRGGLHSILGSMQQKL